LTLREAAAREYGAMNDGSTVTGTAQSPPDGEVNNEVSF